jgi:hypothetical protein
MAEASTESAKIMADFGREQLDFAKQQYADLAPLFEKISQQQLDIAAAGQAQGQDYYDYLKSFRPVEQAMMAESMQDRGAEVGAYDAANKADAEMLTKGDADIYAARKAEIDPTVDQAVADSQGAYTRSINQAIRQGMRYGAAPSQIAAGAGGMGLAQASQTAATANAARRMGIDDVRSRIGLGMQLRQGNMAAKNQQQAIDWAKKLDAAGLVKGLPGASSGAYGLAMSAGNSAGANAMQPGSMLQGAMGQAANTTAQGRQMLQSGLGTVLNSQTQTAGQGGGLETLGAVAGMASKAAPLMMMSDRRLKENIKEVAVDEETGLTIYEYNYIGGTQKYRGVMADEVEQFMPDAVHYDDEGFASVNYGMIGIELEKV